MKYLNCVFALTFIGLSVYYDNWWVYFAYVAGLFYMAVVHEYYEANK